jgi:hypothetical protein
MGSSARRLAVKPDGSTGGLTFTLGGGGLRVTKIE